MTLGNKARRYDARDYLGRGPWGWQGRFLLVRHGETAYNREGRLQGQSDVRLTERGIEQARRVRARLEAFAIDAAFSSDLQRAWETALVALEGRQIAPQQHRGLRERSFGEWEGLTYAEIKAAHGAPADEILSSPVLAPPGGESWSVVGERVSRALREIQQAHPQRTVVVVAHGGVLRTLLCVLLGLDVVENWRLRVDNGSLSIVDLYPHGSILSLLNDTSYLGEYANGR